MNAPGRAAALLMLAVWLGLLGWAVPARWGIEDSLRPQLERQAAVLAGSVSRLVGTALGHGLALTELRGVEAHLDDLRQRHPALAYIAVKDTQGGVRYASGMPEAGRGPEVPISAGPQADAPAGTVEVHVSAAYVRASLRESALDLLVVLVVVAVLVRELMQYVAQAGPGPVAPAAAGSALPTGARLARLRVPLLLFMLSEELTRALVPGFARELALQGYSAPSVSPDLLAGLPIVVFMAVVALGQPVLAVWSERTGRRRALAWGVALGGAGLVGAATASGLAGFVTWRALAGLGWAMVFVAAQGTVVAHTAPSERTRAFAGFVSAILVAGVCGPPLGGMVADHLGTRWGFVLAGSVAGLALLAVRLLPADPRPLPGGAAASGPTTPTPLTHRALPRLLRHRGFVRVTFGAALPAKLLLAGLCFYLVPLVLAAQGAPAAATGRAQMVYALALLAVMPLATRAAERGVSSARLVGGGLALSTLGGLGLAALAAAGWPPGGSVAAIVVAMAVLGAGQGLSIAAQSALLTAWCADEADRHGTGALLGFYRLFERLGNASGPLVAGALVAGLGAGGAFGALAGGVLMTALLFLWFSRREGATA
jgi:MFS family permease